MCSIVVGLEHLESAKFLIQQLQRLEFLRLLKPLLEPVLGLLLLDLFEVGVVIIDMSAA